MAMNRYSSKEPLIFLWIMVPYVFLFNWLLFGNCVFQSLALFFTSFGISTIYFAFIYFLFGLVAVLIKKRFPEDGQLFSRITTMLPLFYLMNLLMVQGLYLVYENMPFLECPVLRSMEWWVTGYGCLCSTIITFFNEGAAGWEKWKTSVIETSTLRKAYHKSRLLCLKRQINPHFLFNCFNTLSSLINENEEEAEKFLDQMTLVYRYLLKGDEVQLVSLTEEVNFARSYLYLTKARFGDAVDAVIDIPGGDLNKKIPPLCLQVILENIIYRNAISKASPLRINIFSTGDQLIVRNSVHSKTMQNSMAYEEGLDDLVNKYTLISSAPVEISEDKMERKIIVPLLKEEGVAI